MIPNTLLIVLRFPIILALRPLIWCDRYQRRMGRKPDEWYWADALCCKWGYVR